jgi:hypothetical protein
MDRARFAGVVKCISELAAMIREVRQVMTIITRYSCTDYTRDTRNPTTNRGAHIDANTILRQIADLIDRVVPDCEIYGDTSQFLPVGFPKAHPDASPSVELAILMLRQIEAVINGANINEDERVCDA